MQTGSPGGNDRLSYIDDARLRHAAEHTELPLSRMRNVHGVFLARIIAADVRMSEYVFIPYLVPRAAVPFENVEFKLAGSPEALSKA